MGPMGLSLTPLLVVALVGCNSISYPTSPAPTSSAAVVATRLVLTVSPTELPEAGGTALVFVETSVDGQQAAPRVRVGVTSTEGTLDAASVMTDDTGHARLSWSGTRASTLTATAGALQTSALVRLAQPVVPPPPSSPPPPPVPLPPDPAPAPVPVSLIVALTANRASAPMHIDVILHATVNAATMQPGETIVGYLWDFTDNNTTDATTTDNTVAHEYAPDHGVMRTKVTAISSSGRRATGTTTILITN